MTRFPTRMRSANDVMRHDFHGVWRRGALLTLSRTLPLAAVPPLLLQLTLTAISTSTMVTRKTAKVRWEERVLAVRIVVGIKRKA